MKTKHSESHAASPSDDSDAMSLKHEFSLLDLFLIIRARWLPALSLSFILTAITVFALFQQPDKYEAVGILLIESRKEHVVSFEDVVQDTATDAYSISRQIETQIERMQSRSFLERVSESMSESQVKDLKHPFRYDKIPEEEIPEVYDMLEDGLEVEAVPGSFMLDVSVRTRSQAGAEALLNAVLVEFIRSSMSDTGQRNDAAVVFLEEQEVILKGDLEKSENNLQAFRQKHKMVSLEDSQNIVVDRMKHLNVVLTGARVKRLELESLANQIDEYMQNDADLLEISAISDYGSIPSLQQTLIQLGLERDVLDERYLRRHPRMIENTQSLETANKQLTTNIDLAVRDVHTDYGKAKQHEKRLTAELVGAENNSLELDQLSVHYNILKRKLDTDRATYQQIIHRLNEARISTQLSDTRLRIIDKAYVSDAPVWPNTIIIAFIGFVVLTATFSMSILALELIDDKITSSWDIEHYLDQRLLGTVPLLDSDKLKTIDELDEDHIRDSLISFYTQIQINSAIQDAVKSIIVTSTIPAEGKSLMSSNLAICYQQHGFNTILIDCDLRKPAIHRIFDLKNKEGYLSYIEGNPKNDTIQLKDLKINKTESGLDVLLTGGRIKSPTPILESNNFQLMLRLLQKTYDIVIVDTPPAVVFPDALIISKHIDEIVLICRHGKVRRKMIKSVLGQFSGSSVEMLGVLINAIPASKSSSYYGYGEYAGKYHDYYNQSSSD